MAFSFQHDLYGSIGHNEPVVSVYKRRARGGGGDVGVEIYELCGDAQRERERERERERKSG